MSLPGAHTKKVLLVPLSWGLGHATRLIPIIHALKKAGVEVLTGGGPDQFKILLEEFPDIQCLKMPYLKIRLSGRRSQIWPIALQLPKIGLYILREHCRLKQLIREYQIDAVISDHCYGLWSKHITSIFITHQLWIKLPHTLRVLERPINNLNHWFIKKYDACWVPDLPENGGLAGELSHVDTLKFPVRYLGLLSRFNNYPRMEKKEASKEKNIVILLSGPEGQRTQFESIIREQLSANTSSYTIKIVRGLPSGAELPGKNWFNHLNTNAMYQLLTEADHIVCRGGYSTLMDLVSLGKTATLVPTPGQTEQLYLADYASKKGLFKRMFQEEFVLGNAIEGPSETKENFRLNPESSKSLLEETLHEFIASLFGELRSETDKSSPLQSESLSQTPR